MCCGYTHFIIMREKTNIQINRREFFRKGINKSLPILTAIVFSNIPIKAGTSSSGCLYNSCAASCSGSCRYSCSSNCKGGCETTCRGACATSCRNTCVGAAYY